MLRKKLFVCFVLSSFFVLMSSIQAYADGSSQSSDTNGTTSSQSQSIKDLRNMVEQQQKVLEELEKKLEALESAQKKGLPAQLTSTPPVRTAQGFEAKMYGFLWTETIHDTEPMAPAADIPFYVVSPSDPSVNHLRTEQFFISPRLSRVGLKMTLPSFSGGWTSSADLEGDFENFLTSSGLSGSVLPHDLSSPSRVTPRLRLAYVKINNGDFYVSIGQQWDLFGAVLPVNNPDGVMWDAGNPGDRREQIQFGYEPQSGFFLEDALGQGGAIDGQDLDKNNILDASASESPEFQLRIGYKGLLNGRPWSVGLFGHDEPQKVNLGAGTTIGVGQSFLSQMMGVDWSVPLSGWLAFNGKIWTGEDLSDVRAGIGQGINTATGKPIGARGGWGELLFHPTPAWLIAPGFFIDQARATDFLSSQASAKVRNEVYTLTSWYAFGNGFQIGINYDYWKTDYLKWVPGVDNHLMFFVQQKY